MGVVVLTMKVEVIEHIGGVTAWTRLATMMFVSTATVMAMIGR